MVFFPSSWCWLLFVLFLRGDALKDCFFVFCKPMSWTYEMGRRPYTVDVSSIRGDGLLKQVNRFFWASFFIKQKIHIHSWIYTYSSTQSTLILLRLGVQQQWFWGSKTCWLTTFYTSQLFSMLEQLRVGTLSSCASFSSNDFEAAGARSAWGIRSVPPAARAFCFGSG